MPKDYHLHLRGSVGDWSFNSNDVNRILDANKDTEVNVLINSLGGRVDTALSISSLFAIHGNVHVHFIGMNASAATIAAMGAKRVTIDAGSCFLVHKCMNLVFEWDYMNADELETHIAALRKMQSDQKTIDSCIAGIYAKRCKKPKDQLLDLMKVGGWLSPQQALDWGFVDEITDHADDAKPVLTEAVASAMFDAGIPLPPLPLRRDSFFDRLKRFFTDSQFDKPSAVTDEIPDPPKKNSTPQSYNMEKYTLLAALIGGTVAVSEGNASLTPEQLGKIEASLSGKDTEIASLRQQLADKDTEISSLNQTVADLRKAPASTTCNVTEASQKTESDGPGTDIDAVVDQLAKAYCS